MIKLTCLIFVICITSLITTSSAATFCDGDTLVENLTVNNDIINITNGGCNLGCSEWTWSSFGNPGCEENDFVLSIFFVVIGIILVIVIRGALK